MAKTIVYDWAQIADGFRGGYSRWGKVGSDALERACNRVFKGAFLPEISPKFRLRRDRGVFTVGSCFARRIEQYPDELGIPIANKYLRQKQLLEEACTLLQAFCGPDLKMTVSPVPLEDTFTGKDVVLANTTSKAILRLAADTFAAAYADVDYFPSYEMVTYSAPRTAYAPDFRHIKNGMVGAITDHFVRHYFD